MARSGGVSSRVLQLVASRDTITGNPVSKIARELGVSQQTVSNIIRDLGSDEKLFVERDCSGRVLSVKSMAPIGHRDRTEKGYWAKKEASFAKGVPAYLPKELCGPVTIRRIDDTLDRDCPEGVEIVDTTYVRGEPYHVTLTKCLQALRSAADASGSADGLSIRMVLVERCKMSDSQATRAMDHLRGMNLYSSAMTGYQTSTYVVDTEVAEITAEDVTAYRRSRKTDKARTEPDRDTTQNGDSVVAQEEPLPDETDPLSALADIIELQDGEIAILRADLGAVNEQRDRLAEELAQARDRIAELERKQARGAMPPRVEQILARHRTPSKS